MASRERVVINIEVNSDVATIEATRAALERLTNENRDLNREYERNRKTVNQTTKQNQQTIKDNDAVGNSLRNVGRTLSRNSSRWKGFSKNLFAFRQDAGKAIGAFGGLISMVNKLAMIELPLLAAGMAGITLLFKSGAFFTKAFQASMSSLAYVAAAVGVAITTTVAALREFQSVQFAPMYSEGAVNTSDRFQAASQAMKMFVDNANVAVAGTQNLQKAFAVLSKQAPVNAGTTAAFEGLMNVVAGSGGDMGKGAEALATFMAKVQKSGLGAAGAEAKALGPDFEKIIKEAQAMGIKTQEEFFKAAAEGNLGETFQKNYAGQLNAVNNTLIGVFKRSIAGIKSIFMDVGQQFLQPVKEGVQQLELIIRRTVLQLSPMLSDFATGGFISNIVEFVDKTATKFVYLMNKYLNTAPGLVEFFSDSIGKIGNFFEKIQDWARQFEDAGQVLIDNFFGPVFTGIMDYFGGGMNTLASLVEANGPMIRSFADTVVDFIGALGDFGNMLKEAFVAAIPVINIAIKGATVLFQVFTKIMNGMLQAFGTLGSGAKALAAVPILYASLVLFSRFFKTFGAAFGKDMTKTMNVRAGVVNVNGAPMGGGGGGPFGRGSRARGARGATGFFDDGVRLFGRGGKSGRFGKFAGRMGGVGSIAALAGSMALDPLAGYFGSKTEGGGAKGYAAGAGKETVGATQKGLAAFSLAQMAGMTAKGAGGLGAVVSLSALAGKGIGSLVKSDSKVARGGAFVGGAAAGALIGSVIPGVGTAAGAIVGGLVGGVSAYMQAGKAKRQAKEAAGEVLNGFYEETEKLFKAGDVAGLNEQLAMLKTTIAESAAGDIETYNKQLEEAQPKIDAIAKKIEIFTKNTTLAEKYLNMNSDALNSLAESAGVDIQGKLLSLRDIIKMTGKTSAEQAQLIKAAWTDINTGLVSGVLGRIQNEVETERLSNEVDAQSLTIASGNFSDEQLRAFVQKNVEFNVAKLGEVSGLASSYEALTNPELFAEGGAFFGMSEENKTRLADAANEYLNPADIARDFLTPEQFALLQNEAGFQGMDNAAIMQKVIAGLDNDTWYLSKLQAAMKTGDEDAIRAAANNTGIATPTGAGPLSTSVTGYVPGSTQTNSNNTYTYTVQLPNGVVLTPDALKKIEDHLKEKQRTDQERGGM
jgi:hypothetical protein